MSSMRPAGKTFVLRTPEFALGAARRNDLGTFVLRTPEFALGAALRAHAIRPSTQRPATAAAAVSAVPQTISTRAKRNGQSLSVARLLRS